jgi:hypothetical protein
MLKEAHIENGISTTGWNSLIKVGFNKLSALFRLKTERGFKLMKLILADSLYGCNIDITLSSG